MARRLFILCMVLLPLTASAQFNVDRLIMSGRSALYYEDYILAIQHFNRAILSKPYLYEPWFLRGVAKFYLDDFVGAENDCDEAIKLNPYVVNLYDLRGLCRIRQGKYEGAISDYDRALKDSPSAQNYWFNRMLCRLELKDYEHAHHDLDTIISKWSNYSRAYSVKASVYLQQKDTVNATVWLDKALEKDPYDAEMWMTRASISLAKEQWKDVDEQLTKAIRLKPNMVPNYVNRISDFDYVLKMEPNNLMATLNRAILLHKTGKLRDAIRDYTKIIDQYPNFWMGLANRAECYRRLGMTAQAELDEFKIFQAQMGKRVGMQQRWSKEQLRQTRKKSEIDMSKYNQYVVEDEEVVEHEFEYDNIYRGKVQNRKVETDYMPMYTLSYFPYANVIKSYQVFDNLVDDYNRKNTPKPTIRLNCNPVSMTEEQSQQMFALIDTLAAEIQASSDLQQSKNLLLRRAVASSVVQNYADAIDDLNTCLEIDNNMALAYWHRAVCLSQEGKATNAQVAETEIREGAAMDDFTKALEFSPNNPYILFDRGNLKLAKGDLQGAIDDYTKAIEGNPHLAEAYYNRGLARINAGKREQGIEDLSKAGELGIYSAYSMIKQNAK